jgi:hypothetical protein
MADMLHGLFVVLKFLFGLGALITLLGIGLVMVWFILYHVVHLMLRHQPTSRYRGLRLLFLESPPKRRIPHRDPSV